MIGLSMAENRNYQFALWFRHTRGYDPSRAEIVAAASRIVKNRTARINAQIDRAIAKGFFAVGRVGTIIPLAPPHERVVAAVCARQRLKPSDITGKRKHLGLIRARRLIARELKRCGYSYSAIGRVLNMHHTSIYDYFCPERARGNRRRSVSGCGERLAA